DVVNPAAMTAEGTPLYGMPVLRADEAAAAIICNKDRMPGYSGVPNPLYDRPNAIFLAGDAAETLATLLAGIKELLPSV
ncbi:MAG: NAD(P)(+) transhydrogenase (Re/Si-specific) subunit beta, partial [Bacteroidota bacterium]